MGGAMGDKKFKIVSVFKIKKFKRTKPQLDIPHLKKSAKGALM